MPNTLSKQIGLKTVQLKLNCSQSILRSNPIQLLSNEAAVTTG